MPLLSLQIRFLAQTRRRLPRIDQVLRAVSRRPMQWRIRLTLKHAGDTVRPHATTSGIAWTRDALVEWHGQRTYVYGRWDRLFGCWRSNEQGQSGKPFTPHWPL